MPPRSSGVRWLVLGLVCLTSFVAYLLRTNMSVAGDAMARDVGLTEIQLGVVLSGFAWGYGIFQLPGGLFGIGLGARRAMTVLFAAWGLLTLATGLVPGNDLIPVWVSMVLLGALRFLLGAAQAPFFPVTSGISFVRWFPPTRWGLVNALGSTSLTLGGAAAGPLVVALMEHFGWRGSFLTLAPVSLLAAVVWWWLYRDDPATHPGVSPREIAIINAGRAPGGDDGGGVAGWRHLVLQRDTLALTASYFCVNYVFYLFFNWFFYYLVEVRRLSPEIGGYFTAAQWIVGAVAAPWGGWLCDYLSRRYDPGFGCRATVSVGMLCCAPLLVAGSLAASPYLALALLSLAFGTTQMVDAAYWAAGMRIGGARAAATTGLMNTGGNVVGGIGALLVPLLSHLAGWTVALSSGAVFALLAAAFWRWIRVEAVTAAQEQRAAA